MSRPKLTFVLDDGTVLEVPDLPGAVFNLERYKSLKAKLLKSKSQPPKHEGQYLQQEQTLDRAKA